LLAAVTVANCGGGEAPPPLAPKATVLQLPRGTWPTALAFDDKGTLWIAESSADTIAERRRGGRLVHHRLGEATETSVGDIVPLRTGDLWFQGFQLIGWISPDGTVSGYQLGFNGDGRPEVGSPTAMAKGPDENIWYTSESVPPAIKRVTPNGAIRTYPLPEGGDAGLDLQGIAAGPDGAVWFTEVPIAADGPPEAIGRLEPTGGYTRHALPKPKSGPRRIVAGPDAALWFTEASRSRIGRISAGGKITEFALKPGSVPDDIVSGSDGALWFTTPHALGRITTSGSVRMWPIPGAKRLARLAEDRDHTFWITDPERDAVHHFDPAPA